MHENRHVIVRVVGLLAGQHFVQHDAETVDIAARVDLLAMALLRAHVVRRAEDQSLVGHFHLQRHVFGETEIDQRDAAVVAQHHVSGFQIAVQDADLVDGLQRIGEIARIGQ